MSRPAPLVLSRNVLSCDARGVDDLHFGHSLSLGAPKPEPPPSRPLIILSREAFWVNPSDDADEAVKALHLEMRVADAPALSQLTVQGSEGVYMDIHAVAYNVIVLRWCCHQSHVYLVYHAVHKSITMIPSDPWSCTPYQREVKRSTTAATSVLIAPARPPGSRPSYALVKIAETAIYKDYNYEPSEKKDLVYVWRAWVPSCPWEPISASIPPLFKGDTHIVAHSYATVLSFTCRAHAFWANLFRGIMYCNVEAMILGPITSKLKFDFIKLPVDDPPCPISCALELYSDMYRTIGCSGESIKFVIIDGFVQHKNLVDCKLKVWSISPDEMTTWSTECILLLDSLVEQDEFKKAGLSADMVPMYPRLSAWEEDVVYFMLGEYKKCCRAHKGSKNRCNGYIPTAKNPRCHLRVDMHRGVLLAAARLPDQSSPYVCITRVTSSQ